MSNFILAKALTIKFTEEERQSIQSRINKLIPELNTQNTAREMLHALLDVASNPAQNTSQEQAAAQSQEVIKTLSEQITKASEEILNSHNEIGRLKTLTTLKEEEIKSLRESKTTEPTPGITLGQYEEVITFDPIFAALLDEEIEAGIKITGTTATRAGVLKTLFLDMVKHENTYPLYKQWSREEIRKVKEKIKAKLNLQ